LLLEIFAVLWNVFCVIPVDRPSFNFPELEETRHLNLKHLIRARPKPKKRIKILQVDRRQNDYSLPQILPGFVHLKGKAVGQGTIAKLPIENLFSSREEEPIDYVRRAPENRFAKGEQKIHVQPVFEGEERRNERRQKTELMLETAAESSSPELLEFADFVKVCTTVLRSCNIPYSSFIFSNCSSGSRNGE
jgi:hypothetical protein